MANLRWQLLRMLRDRTSTCAHQHGQSIALTRDGSPKPFVPVFDGPFRETAPIIPEPADAAAVEESVGGLAPLVVIRPVRPRETDDASRPTDRKVRLPQTVIGDRQAEQIDGPGALPRFRHAGEGVWCLFDQRQDRIAGCLEHFCNEGRGIPASIEVGLSRRILLNETARRSDCDECVFAPPADF